MPADPALYSCEAFLLFRLGRCHEALQAAERCMEMCAREDIAPLPHVQWLIAGLEQQPTTSLGMGAGHLTEILADAIIQGGSLTWQCSDLLVALPALLGESPGDQDCSRHQVMSRMVKQNGELWVTPPRDVSVRSMLDQPFLRQCNQQAGMTEGPGPTETAPRSGHRAASRPSSCRDRAAETALLERMYAISCRPHERLHPAVEAALAGLLGLPVAEGPIASQAIQELLMLYTEMSGLERLLAAMLAPGNILVEGAGDQLLFQGPDGNQLSLFGPEMPAYLRDRVACLFMQGTSRRDQQWSQHGSPHPGVDNLGPLLDAAIAMAKARLLVGWVRVLVLLLRCSGYVLLGAHGPSAFLCRALQPCSLAARQKATGAQQEWSTAALGQRIQLSSMQSIMCAFLLRGT